MTDIPEIPEIPEIPVHPVQNYLGSNRRSAQVPQSVTLRAYEAYCKLYGEQKELITGDCRGGFGVNELIGLLYAMTYPKSQWRARFNEALTGMKNV